MKKERKIWGKGVFNFIIALLQCVLILALISNTIIISYSIVRLAIDIKNDNLDNYYETFYSTEEDDSNFISIENDWNKEEIEMIENGEISHGEIVGASWLIMIASEIYIFCIITILGTSRKFIKNCQKSVFQEENLIMLRKMKINLVIAYVVPLIMSIFCIIFTSISIHYTLNILVVLAFYALFDFISYIISQGIKPPKESAEA